MAEGKFDLKLVPEYNGTTSVVDWLERVDLICKLSGVDKVEQVIPLRLAEGAFDVYQQLSDADKTNVTRRAFTLDPCETYKQFSRRTLRLDESVDEFYAALKKQPVRRSPRPDPEVCVHGRSACPYPGVVACICQY